MNDAEQQKQFAWSVEDKFLPTVIKPGRYASVEWICPRESDSSSASAFASEQKSSLPQAVVVSLKSYERSANDPQICAIRLALLDSDVFQVGMTYPFGVESLEALESLNLAPFSGPDFSPLSQANVLIVPLDSWVTLWALPKVLDAAGIAMSRKQRQSAKAPKLVALLGDDLQSDSDTAVPDVVAEIFDSTVTLADFLAAPARSLDVSEVADSPLPVSPFSPNRPIVPLVEISQHRARFKFSSGSQLKSCGFDEASVSAALVKAVKLSGLKEVELEGCANLLGSISLAEVIDSLAHKIDVRRYALSLRDLGPEQVTPLLTGALGRFRRVRIELSLNSLSKSAHLRSGANFDSEKFVTALRLLQVEPVQTLHLCVELGFGLDQDIEAQETSELILVGAKMISPQRGLRIKYVRHISRFDAIPNEEELQLLYEAIKKHSRAKGVTFVLEDSFARLLGALIERGAFTTIEEFSTFVNSNTDADDIYSAFEELLSKQYARSTQDVCVPAIDEEPTGQNDTKQCQALNPLSVSNGATNGSVNGASFGRRKKRNAVTIVATPTKTRLRFAWSVTGPARFLSHLDNIRALESALLRSGMELAYTQGQRPRLKIAFGAPKPVGFTSECELFDAYFETIPTSSDIAKLNKFLPPGYKIVSATQSMTKELSILESIKCVTYLIGLCEDNLEEKLSGALAQNRLVYTRRNKKRERQVDLRPGIFEARVLDVSDNDHAKFFNFATLGPDTDGLGRILKLTLALTDTFHVRPEEFLAAAGILSRDESTKTRIHRLRYGFETPPPLRVESDQLLNVSS